MTPMFGAWRGANIHEAERVGVFVGTELRLGATVSRLYKRRHKWEVVVYGNLAVGRRISLRDYGSAGSLVEAKAEADAALTKLADLACCIVKLCASSTSETA